MTCVHATDTTLWQLPDHALAYLAQADAIPHRQEGETALLECLSQPVRRLLDLGSGDGRLLGLVALVHPDAHAVALDFSETMIERLKARFADRPLVGVVRHDLNATLPSFDGPFDTVVSSFAIHHLMHSRKRALYGEIFDRMTPGGVFCNLEHVASATRSLHAQFLERLGIAEEDPSNKLLDVETQLSWLREIGFADVDCHWKWRELALLTGTKPSLSPAGAKTPPRGPQFRRRTRTAPATRD